MITKIFIDDEIFSNDEIKIINRLVIDYESNTNKEELLIKTNNSILKYPQNPYLHFVKGHLNFDLGNYDEAILDFAYFVNKTYYQGYFQTALCFFKQGKYEKALDLYNTALVVFQVTHNNNSNKDIQFGNWFFPSESQILNNRAAVNYNLQLYRAAIEDCTLAIKSNESYSNPFFMRGMIYDRMQKYDAAVSDFIKAHELGHSHPNIKGIIKETLEECDPFFVKIKEYVTLIHDANDNQRQHMAYKMDLIESKAFQNIEFETAFRGQKENYRSTLKYSMEYAQVVFNTLPYTNNADFVLAVICYNISTVFEDNDNTINQYELFIDTFKRIRDELI